DRQEVKIRTSKIGVATVNGSALSAVNVNEVVGKVDADGVIELTFANISTDAASAVFTVEVGNFKKTISVSAVKAAALAGYAVELSATKLDMSTATTDTDPNAINDKSATVKVYQKDVNGNKIGEVTAGVEVKDASGGAVTVSGTTINTNEVGTEV